MARQLTSRTRPAHDLGSDGRFGRWLLNARVAAATAWAGHRTQPWFSTTLHGLACTRHRSQWTCGDAAMGW